MRKQKIYSESEAIQKTGFTLKQLEERIGAGDVKSLVINGKKYYRLSKKIIKQD